MFRHRPSGGRLETEKTARASCSQYADRSREDDDGGALYDGGGGRVLWCGIARNEALLVQAGGEIDPTHRSVATTAQQLLDKPATAGFEFHTQQLSGDALFLPRRGGRLRGIKFNVYEDNNHGDVGGEASSSITAWVYAAVYRPHSRDLTQRHVKAFLEKVVVLTEPFRDRDDAWRQGGNWAAQRSFGPILEQQMRDFGGRDYRAALLEERLGSAQALMRRNIEVLLDREERLQSLQDRAGQLNEAAQVFRKNARRVRRMKMLQDAKYGILIGAAVTIGVAIVVVPPLVALL